jgi:hypothetical protein
MRICAREKKVSVQGGMVDEKKRTDKFRIRETKRGEKRE